MVDFAFGGLNSSPLSWPSFHSSSDQAALPPLQGFAASAAVVLLWSYLLRLPYTPDVQYARCTSPSFQVSLSFPPAAGGGESDGEDERGDDSDADKDDGHGEEGDDEEANKAAEEGKDEGETQEIDEDSEVYNMNKRSCSRSVHRCNGAICFIIFCDSIFFLLARCASSLCFVVGCLVLSLTGHLFPHRALQVVGGDERASSQGGGVRAL